MVVERSSSMVGGEAERLRRRTATAVAGPGGLARQVARGLTMGAADLVPGVSGGTMALVFGIYEPLIAAVREAAGMVARVLRLDLAGGVAALRRLPWRFLLPLLAGIATAIIVLAGPLTALLDREPVLMSAAFFGLIVGSIAVTLRGLRQRDAVRLTTLVVVAALTFVVLGVRGSGVDDPSLPMLFGGGALAICAMILPGVSGSLLLVMIGLYDAVLHVLNSRAATGIAVFVLGAGVGLALFATLLNWLLEHHRETVLAALIGLMAGSLRVLWMWPSDGGVEDVRLGAPVAADVPGVLVTAMLAVVAVLLLARLARVPAGG